MKKIAITLNTTWNIYNFRLNLMKKLRSNGYKVIAIAPKDNYVEKLQQEGFEWYDLKLDNNSTNPLKELKTIFNFYQVYKRVNPDIILQYTIKPNIYGSIAGGLLGIPIISNISGLGTVFLNNSLSSKVAKLMYRFSLKIPKKVFFQNRDDRDLFQKNRLVDIKKTDILPGSGIDIEKFAPVKHMRDDNKIRFLMIARLVKDKGVIEYLKSAEIIKQRYKNVEFLLLGSFYCGNPTSITEYELNKWIYKGVVNYLGVSDNVQEEIAKVDCVVLPSYREGLSRVLLESASMAKPIITTNTAGCRDVVDDNVNGYLCEVKNHIDLANKMEKMINLDEIERVEMGKRGREKIVQNFDEKIVIDRYLDAIKMIEMF